MFPGRPEAVARRFLQIVDDALKDPDGSHGQVGPYRVLEEIGRGGRAIVYRAEDTRLDRIVALKTVPLPLGGDRSAAAAQLRREARLAARVDHPGLCTVYDVGTDGEVLFVAMPLVDGETLATSLARARGAASSAGEVERLVRLGEEMARALQAAHDGGVIHCDVKPSNVMLTREGRAVLLDFGLARASDEVTVSGGAAVAGTPSYLPPEAWNGEGVPDARRDVYSLGATLYEALAGRRPFEAPTEEMLRRRVTTAALDDPRLLNPHLSRDLARVLSTALARDPRDRYATVGALADELGRVLRGEPIRARPVGRLVRGLRWCRRQPVLAVGVGLLFLLPTLALIMAVHLLAEVRQSTVERRRSETTYATALAQGRQLEDHERLEELAAWADRLWPARPALVGGVTGMEAWLAEARQLRGRLARHRRQLAELRRRALPWSADARAKDRAVNAAAAPEVRTELDRLQRRAARFRRSSRFADRLSDTLARIRELEGELTTRRTWEFRDAWSVFRHDVLTALIGQLEELPQRIEEMDRRMLRARTIVDTSITRHRHLWSRACAAARRPADGARPVALAPIVGLVPLGPDPASGLQEFACIESGEVPRRRTADGRLEIGEASAIVMVLIPGRVTRMGCRLPRPGEDPSEAHVDPLARPNEGPVHVITLRSYLIAKHEVTQAQWLRLSGRNPSFYRPGTRPGFSASLRHPVESVSWEEARRVLRRIGLRLPTESHWEHAARGGTTSPWWTGYRAEDVARCEHVRSGGNDPRLGVVPVAVDATVPNPFGLYGMLGNVREWCRDRPASYAEPVDPRTGTRPTESPPGTRIARGGIFMHGESVARVAQRVAIKEESVYDTLGVRPVLELSDAEQ